MSVLLECIVPSVLFLVRIFMVIIIMIICLFFKHYPQSGHFFFSVINLNIYRIFYNNTMPMIISPCLLFTFHCFVFYPNAYTTHMPLPDLYFDYSSYFGKCGFLFKDHENVISKFESHISKKELNVFPTQIPLCFLTQRKPKPIL